MVTRRGMTLTELLAALLLVSVIASGAVYAGAEHFHALALQLDRLRAQRAAAAALEAHLAGPAPALGERTLAAPDELPEASVLEQVRQHSPGLRAIAVTVRWHRGGPRELQLLTLKAEEPME